MYVLDVFQADIETKILEMDQEIKVRGKLGKQQNFTELSQSCILNRSESTATQTLDDRPVISWDQAAVYGRWKRQKTERNTEAKKSASEAVDWGGEKGSAPLSPA